MEGLRNVVLVSDLVHVLGTVKPGARWYRDEPLSQMRQSGQRATVPCGRELR